MSDTNNISIGDEDLPILFQVADTTSKQSQRHFNNCVAFDLVFISLSSLAGAISYNSTSAKVGFGIISFASMLIGLVFTVYIRSQKFEQNWYNGRAVAESVKTRAWRFMTCSAPYDTEDEQEAKTIFLKNLIEVRNERKEFCAELSIKEVGGQQITQKMLSVRHLPLLERKSLYIVQRIDEQRKWYSEKAKDNQRSAIKWSNAILIAQSLGCLASLILILYPDFPINASSVIAGVASALIAWLQMKRHRELATSYSLATQELGSIVEQSEAINQPKALSDFILDAENAISREHTLWSARRDLI